MHLRLRHLRLRTRHRFTIARGTTTGSTAVLVELEQDGATGYGEAPESAYYGATAQRTAAAVESVRKVIESTKLESGPRGKPSTDLSRSERNTQDPIALWERLAAEIGSEPFSLSAIDCAAWDLWGKLQGEPVWMLWGLSPDRAPPCDYTLGIDSPEMMVRKLEEFPDFPVYKIKLGTPDDLAIVRHLRQHTAAAFRVDANGGWTAEQTLRNASALAELGVELIEQPLPPDRWDEMRQVAAQSPLPILADESCLAWPPEEAVERCAGYFHGINIKPPKCGGLTPARWMIDRARRLGLKVMIGCFTETTVGISAYAQLLPMADYADVDGALLLAEDVATGVRIDRGRVLFAAENGCGVRMIGKE
jgi:L-alanine-DL-glutamate epimerase-like enolase superfamily enzyme